MVTSTAVDEPELKTLVGEYVETGLMISDFFEAGGADATYRLFDSTLELDVKPFKR